jgi:hypothetical protein
MSTYEFLSAPPRAWTDDPDTDQASTVNASTSRRRMIGGIVVASVAVFAGFTQAVAGRSPSKPAEGGPVVTVHNGVAAGQHSSVSGDGRFLAYTAPPAPAADGSNDGRTSSAWLRDLAAKPDTPALEVTLPGTGIAPGDSTTPVLSSDGCSLVVVTQLALDLFRDADTGARWDVYSLRTPACGGRPNDWTLVSELGSGAANNVIPGSPPAVSGAGTIIAYTQQFSRAEPELSAIVVADLTVQPDTPGRQVRLRGTPPAGPQGNFRYQGLRQPAVSDDGSIIAFTSDAVSDKENPEWGAGPVDGEAATSHVFVWDRKVQNGVAVKRLTRADANGGSSHPSISGAGHLIAFQSTATNLVDNTRFPTCDIQCQPQVFLKNQLDDSTRLLSGTPATKTAPAVAGDGAALDPVINRDGATVVFVSRAQNLFPASSGPPGGPNEGDVVAADLLRTDNALRRVSLLGDDVSPLPAVNARPAISGNARVISFDTAVAVTSADGSTAPGREVVARREAAKVEIADIDVGTVNVGLLGDGWFQRLINTGRTSFTPTDFGSTTPEFLVANECQIGVPLLPGDSCRVRVSLTPAVEGPYAGSVTIKDTSFLGAEATMYMKGAGGLPRLSPATDSDAGGRWEQTVVGQDSVETKKFNIRNVGFEPAAVTRPTVAGDNPNDFTVLPGGCGTAAVSPGGTCTVEVKFRPTASGHRTALLRVAAVDGTYTNVLLDGDAFYEPGVVADMQTAQGGDTITLNGVGYPPGSGVSVSWSDGFGITLPAITDKSGAFTLQVPVSMAERSGDRVLVASAFSGETATVDVTVLPTQQPTLSPASPAFPRP